MKKTGSAKSPNQDADESNSFYHTPVMLSEAVDALNIKPAGTYVDCTFGGGGHSKEILRRLNDEGHLIVFDQDEDAKKNLPDDARILFVPQNFRHLQRFIKFHKHNKVDGILADLGVSSFQFDEPERGFSTRFDAALDMRMDKRQRLTAADILRDHTELQLHKMFEKYGEVTNAKTLAKTIVAQRESSAIKTISGFKTILQSIVKGNPNKYFAQVFQALRIEVNDEMNALKELLSQSLQVLNTGGRLVVITFHSLEDREVKNFFKTGSFEEVAGDEVFGTRPTSPFKIITKKPVEASEAEVKQNPRARSAKMRAAEKL